MIFFEYLLVGFAGSLCMIALMKGIVVKILQRDTNYYDDVYEGGGEADD